MKKSIIGGLVLLLGSLPIFSSMALVPPIYKDPNFSVNVIDNLDILRVIQGLPLVQNDDGLVRAAQWYANIMAYERKMSHDFLTSGDKWNMIQMASPEHQSVRDSRLFELIGRVSQGYFDTYMSVAHFFDPSPEHAVHIYATTAQYMGWAATLGSDGFIYICVYVSEEP